MAANDASINTIEITTFAYVNSVEKVLLEKPDASTGLPVESYNPVKAEYLSEYKKYSDTLNSSNDEHSSHSLTIFSCTSLWVFLRCSFPYSIKLSSFHCDLQD